MRRVMAGPKTFLLGDATAELLLRYAVVLGKQQSADAVELMGLEESGESARLRLLLNGGTVLLTESVQTALPEPDNAAADRALVEAIDRALGRWAPPAEEIAGIGFWDRVEDED